MLRNGSTPPAFRLPDSAANWRFLDELRATKPLVVLFFRGAFCATARRDLLAWSDIHERIDWLGANLVAISVDPVEELARLKAALELSFPLLSDAGFAVSREWGIYESDERDAGPQPHGEPGTFVLDAAGKLAFSQLQSGPKGAAPANEVLLMLLLMQRQNGFYW